MSNGIFELVLILALILLNGVLAMAEIATVSARKARLQQLANEGDEKSRQALNLASDPSDLLSTVQIGITLVGILAGAFGGATFADRIAAWLSAIPALAPYANAIALALVVVAITYLSLILGELVPKRLALINPERVIRSLAGPMQLLAKIVHPIVRLLSVSTDLVLRLLGARSADEPPITEEEIKLLIEQGTEAGVFQEAEQDMVAGVFRLGDRRVGSLMTPRTEIYWLDLEDPPEAIRDEIIASPFSRLPVAAGDLDNIRGIVRAKDLLARSLAGQPVDVAATMVEPMFVPESMEALKVLEQFRSSGFQIALVIDEFGGLQGLVTLTDVLESIVGEIPAVDEAGEPEIVQREDGSYLLDGMVPIDEFKAIFRRSRLPNEERGYYQTLGGFIMDYLGRIPNSGDHFDWDGLRFEVVDMDGFRVDKIIVAPEAHTGENP